MKARNENGRIKFYSKLPSKYCSATLNIAGGFHLLPEEIHQAEGFFDVVVPEFDDKLQMLGELYFDQDSNIFTYPVTEKTFDLQELKDNLLSEFDVVLNEFAVIIARCRFIHDPAPQGLLDAIETAKITRVNTIAAINALPTVADALAFSIKKEDVEYLRSLFTPYL